MRTIGEYRKDHCSNAFEFAIAFEKSMDFLLVGKRTCPEGPSNVYSEFDTLIYLQPCPHPSAGI